MFFLILLLKGLCSHKMDIFVILKTAFLPIFKLLIKYSHFVYEK